MLYIFLSRLSCRLVFELEMLRAGYGKKKNLCNGKHAYTSRQRKGRGEEYAWEKNACLLRPSFTDQRMHAMMRLILEKICHDFKDFPSL